MMPGDARNVAETESMKAISVRSTFLLIVILAELLLCTSAFVTTAPRLPLRRVKRQWGYGGWGGYGMGGYGGGIGNNYGGLDIGSINVDNMYGGYGYGGMGWM
ncbi:unnamed protein product [Anisakis simplex]|uniref:Glycine rich protein n=1 Tax=Anisakis simplex TaxID=6269 RepID=A0A0M3J3X2_ANISI|nr:unnamed protein product [Anisakis simplex]